MSAECETDEFLAADANSIKRLACLHGQAPNGDGRKASAGVVPTNLLDAGACATLTWRHMRIWRPLLISVLLIFSSVARAYVIQPGASRDDVISTYGHPASRAAKGEREILNYREGSVVLEQGRVVELRFTKNEPRIVRQAPVVPPAAVRTAVPTKILTQPAASSKKEPQAAQQRPQPQPVPPMLGFRVWFYAVPALVLFFIAAVILKAQARRHAGKRGGVGTDRVNEVRPSAYEFRATPATEVTRLDRESLDRLEWRRFEELIHGYFETQGWKPQRSRIGADGGIDIFLYRPGEQKPGACVQCKAWHSYTVGVKPVRELLGVMSAEGIPEGYFVATGGYTAEALAFAAGKRLHLLTGSDLLNRFQALSEADHSRVVKHAFRGDFETPTCPSCDEKMVLRQAKTPFWGCRNFPRCRQTFKVRS